MGSFPSPWRLSLATHRVAAGHWLLENKGAELFKFASICLHFPVRPVIIEEREDANEDVCLQLIRFALLLVEKDRGLGRRIKADQDQETRFVRHVKGVIQVLVLAQYDMQLGDDAFLQRLAQVAPPKAVQRFTKRALQLQRQIRVLSGKRGMGKNDKQVSQAIGGKLSASNIKQIVHRTSTRLALISAWSCNHLTEEEFHFLHRWAGTTFLNPVLGCKKVCERPDGVYEVSHGRLAAIDSRFAAHNLDVTEKPSSRREERARGMALNPGDIELIGAITKPPRFLQWSCKYVEEPTCCREVPVEKDCRLGNLIYILWGEIRLKRWRLETGLIEVEDLILGLEDGGFWPE